MLLYHGPFKKSFGNKSLHRFEIKMKLELKCFFNMLNKDATVFEWHTCFKEEPEDNKDDPGLDRPSKTWSK